MAIVIRCDKCGCYLNEYTAKAIQFYSASNRAFGGGAAVERVDCCEYCYNETLARFSKSYGGKRDEQDKD